jgi:heterogeneous nuclear ribonucleoprotein A1/A3
MTFQYYPEYYVTKFGSLVISKYPFFHTFFAEIVFFKIKRGSIMSQNTVFMGSLPYQISSTQLKDICQTIGEIEQVRLITDRDTGQSKGFAFVTYAKQADAETAIVRLNGKEIEGRNIVVNMAKAKMNHC